MKMKRKIRFGLPVGSLNHPDRWQTKAFLDKAGFYTRGYEPGNRKYNPEFIDHKELAGVYLEAVAVRPQNAPYELNRKDPGGLDIAILAQDWADEGEAAGYPTRQLCELGYGNVKIVAAVPKDLAVNTISDLLKARAKDNRILRCYTEYVNLGRKTLYEDEAYTEIHGEIEPQVIVKGVTVGGENHLVQIIDSQGTTELICPSRFGEIIIDNVQTGTTLEANGYRVVKEIGKSCACLYTSPYITPDTGWKYEEVQFIKRMLESVAQAEKYDYFIFDFPKSSKDEIVAYLKEKGLFTKEPVLKEGVGFCETSILVPKEKGLIVIRDLEKHGATAIVKFLPKQTINV